MRARPNPRRPLRAWAATLLAMAILLTSGLAAMAQTAEPAATTSSAYLPLVIAPVDLPNGPRAVRFPPDTARAASVVIGPDGGTLTATGADGTRYELQIPPDALGFSEVITRRLRCRLRTCRLAAGWSARFA
jgi:hypothetical protein